MEPTYEDAGRVGRGAPLRSTRTPARPEPGAAQGQPKVRLRSTGVLVHRNQTHRLDLGSRSAADVLTAVTHTLPEGVERIYITAGDPWHRDADRHPYLRDAVAAWLNAPASGWRTDTDTGRGRMAGHFIHARSPVGRYQSRLMMRAMSRFV
ncbi:hypothetical protein [Streptomyces albogriseolus]|uniref:hypothetical protein n=1 Tax=Streptomyces albogriseolus TaxID=1887 RepID=UPI00345F6B19